MKYDRTSITTHDVDKRIMTYDIAQVLRYMKYDID